MCAWVEGASCNFRYNVASFQGGQKEEVLISMGHSLGGSVLTDKLESWVT